MDGDQLNVVVFVQARMSSTRLPGKVYKKILGEPLLIHLVRRVQRAQFIDRVVVITSSDSSDDPIEMLCRNKGIDIFRGNLTNLLDRHLSAAEYFNADICLKIPSDCPLIDPEIIDSVLQKFFETDVEYCSNLHPMTLPDGMDVEIFTMNALKKAYNLAETNEEFEHTTTRMWKSQEFKSFNVEFTGYVSLISSHRFTVDYEEDFILVKKIFEKLLPYNTNFGLDDIVKLMDSETDLCNINANRVGDIWYLR